MNMHTVHILHSRCRSPHSDGIVLREHDFHPCRPFFLGHPQIRPETVERIHIRGMLEQHPFLRCVLRCCDYMLTSGGTLEIDFFNAFRDYPGRAVRGQYEWRYELSLVFGDRIRLEQVDDGPEGHFVFKKTGACLPKDDSMDRWTFGIVSDGRRNDRIRDIIHTIYSFRIPQFEVLICGPAPGADLPPFVRVIDEAPCYVDRRIPISRKKNLLIQQARYNNLVILHDRISFPPDWYAHMCLYGNYYDLLCSPILNEADSSRRMEDWVTSPHSFFTLSKWERFRWHKIYLDYDEWSKDLFVNGGFIQIKRHLIAPVRLNPHLFWGEYEGIDLSQRLYQTGVLTQFYQGNRLYSMGTRFRGVKSRPASLFRKIRHFLGAYKKYVREERRFIRYLKG